MNRKEVEVCSEFLKVASEWKRGSSHVRFPGGTICTLYQTEDGKRIPQVTMVTCHNIKKDHGHRNKANPKDLYLLSKYSVVVFYGKRKGLENRKSTKVVDLVLSEDDNFIEKPERSPNIPISRGVQLIKAAASRAGASVYRKEVDGIFVTAVGYPIPECFLLSKLDPGIAGLHLPTGVEAKRLLENSEAIFFRCSPKEQILKQTE